MNFVAWFELRFPMLRSLLTLGSIGENIGARRMARLKQMGLCPGYPDLVLYYPSGACPGLLVEMKTKKGRLSAAQLNIHAQLRERGYQVGVARSWEEAKDIFEKYINGPTH